MSMGLPIKQTEAVLDVVEMARRGLGRGPRSNLGVRNPGYPIDVATGIPVLSRTAPDVTCPAYVAVVAGEMARRGRTTENTLTGGVTRRGDGYNGPSCVCMTWLGMRRYRRCGFGMERT